MGGIYFHATPLAYGIEEKKVLFVAYGVNDDWVCFCKRLPEANSDYCNPPITAAKRNFKDSEFFE